MDLVLGRAAAFLETRDAFGGVLLASDAVRTEALAHFEAASFRNYASGAIIAEIVANCRQLTTLNLTGCHRLTALPKRLGDSAALTTLNLANCISLTALLERLGDCTALRLLGLSGCRCLERHLEVFERMKARGCVVNRYY